MVEGFFWHLGMDTNVKHFKFPETAIPKVFFKSSWSKNYGKSNAPNDVQIHWNYSLWSFTKFSKTAFFQTHSECLSPNNKHRNVNHIVPFFKEFPRSCCMKQYAIVTSLYEKQFILLQWSYFPKQNFGRSYNNFRFSK